MVARIRPGHHLHGGDHAPSAILACVEGVVRGSVVSRGVELAYFEYGSGVETVVFAHSYLVDHRQFEAQIEALRPSYRIIAYDHRDHGASGRARRAYRLDDLVADAARVIEATDAGPCHFVGLSTGGFVGMRLAVRHPELLRSLTLMDTSGQAEPLVLRAEYQALFLALRVVGIGPLMGIAMKKMFAASVLRDPSRTRELDSWRRTIASNDPRALIRFGNAIFERDDVTEPLRSVRLPTLVVVGQEDIAQPPKRSEHLARAIPGAALEIIPRAGHLSTIDNPEAVNAALVPFIAGASS